MTTSQIDSPVQLVAADAPDQPTPTPELDELYRGFENELLVPLWTEIGDLMPAHPQSKAPPHVWRWDALLPAGRAAPVELVPVGRGGERRAIALANPSLGGRPFATPTLWAAIQYLMPGEDAPEHRHTQHAFRFVVEGEGVWTVVDGDPVADAPRRLPAAGGLELARAPQRHRQADGLDRRPGHPVPVRHRGPVLRVRPRRRSATRSGSPRTARAPSGCGATPGLRPSASPRAGPGTPAARLPLGAHRPRPGRPARARGRGLPRHGRARPRRGPLHQPDDRRRRAAHDPRRDAPRPPRRRDRSAPRGRLVGLPGLRRLRRGHASATQQWTVDRGDLFVVPSWQPFSVRSEAGATDSDSGALDLFRFSDTPIFEALQLHRVPAWKEPTHEARHPPHQPAPTAPPAPSASTGTRSSTSARPTSAPSSPRPTGRPARPRSADGHDVRRGRRRDFAAARPAPVEGGLRRPQLPQPHPGDGPRPARAPDAVLQVRRHPHRRRATTSSGPPRPTRSTGRSSSPWSSARRYAAPTTARGRGGDRRLHRAQRHHLPRLAVPHPRVAAGQELGLAPPRSARTWSPPTSCPAAYGPTLDVRLSVDGEVMQSDTTGDLLFDPVALVEYVSTMVRLNPGDVIATGTPGGVGHARTPKRYLRGRRDRRRRDRRHRPPRERGRQGGAR